jgi:hypothetical protein
MLLAVSVSVSAVGLLIGLVLLVGCVLLGQWGARESGHRWVALVGLIVGIILLLVLGFDFSDESETVNALALGR